MGWKKIKEHYRIEHFVQVTEEGICIGSPHIHNIIVISMDGKIIKPYDNHGNEDLVRYMTEIKADPEKFRKLVQEPDVFDKSITVYTYDGGKIIEKKCEVLGWPNVTHDGDMMYKNTFSDNKQKVVKWAIEDAQISIDKWQERIEERKRDLAKAQDCLVKAWNDLELLKSEYQKA